MSSFSSLNDNDLLVYQSFEKLIDGKLRKTFPSIPSDFQLKTVSVCRVRGCGMFYDFKIALPDDKFAKASFNSDAGYVMGTKVSDPTEDCITIQMI
ncbi:unnamed protein product [Rotaria magnacalcarata]|uniref:Uncharacterized protein n=1 Tax=Rotaria magnacalcarata TaxID=392030 RepID=A0A816FQA4_9BILA|nr:unnamed protein product [Rotaria magnacalcarata]CAF1664717.1 unnamed protein product [Rotaria magnacalcarata]CAF3825015.1 unnamed protein product [Rotaria magnacalcarata]CAF3835510.1 unnamed protein product [Rotaria magnacalcarata]